MQLVKNFVLSKKFVLVSLFIVLSGVLLLSGCNFIQDIVDQTKKTPISLEEFKTKAIELGWTVNKTSGSYDNYVATKNGAQVDFYDCGSVDAATLKFNDDWDRFENLASRAQHVTNSADATSDSYQYYKKNFNGVMHLLVRCGSTYVFCDSTVNHEDEVDALISAIGY